MNSSKRLVLRGINLGEIARLHDSGAQIGLKFEFGNWPGAIIAV